MAKKKSKKQKESKQLCKKDDFKRLSRAEDDGFPITQNFDKDIVELCEEEENNNEGDSRG